MEKGKTIPTVVFDYTSFLGAPSKNKMTFLDILTSIAPVFATVWKDSVQEQAIPEDRLWERASKTLSTQHSDESNLIRLFRLAKQEGIAELTLIMPYELDESQIALIREKTDITILCTSENEFKISL